MVQPHPAPGLVEALLNIHDVPQVAVRRHARIFVTRDSLPTLVEVHGRVWLLGPEAECPSLARDAGLRYEALARWRGSALGILTR